MYNNRFTRWISERLWHLLTPDREPDVVIGPGETPYLMRWYLIPRNRFLNVYFHLFLRSDDDRALHDHPWWSMSFVLMGQCLEHYYASDADREAGKQSVRTIPEGSVVFRGAAFAHRIELLKYQYIEDAGKPMTTLFITGPRFRSWGFWCDNGKRFVDWKIFTKPGDTGKIGRGCD